MNAMKQQPTKCDFERSLNDLPVPESARNKYPEITKTCKYYGSWWRRQYPDHFNEAYSRWVRASKVAA